MIEYIVGTIIIVIAVIAFLVFIIGGKVKIFCQFLTMVIATAVFALFLPVVLVVTVCVFNSSFVLFSVYVAMLLMLSYSIPRAVIYLVKEIYRDEDFDFIFRRHTEQKDEQV